MSSKRRASNSASRKDMGWVCQFCTLENESKRKRCNACEARRPLVDLPYDLDQCAAGKPSLISPRIRKPRRKSIKDDVEILVYVRLMGTSGWHSLPATKQEPRRVSKRGRTGTPTLASTVKNEHLHDNTNFVRSMNYVASLARIEQQVEAPACPVETEDGLLDENTTSTFSPFTSQNDNYFDYMSQTQQSQWEVATVSETTTTPSNDAESFAHITASEQRLWQRDDRPLLRLPFGADVKGPLDVRYLNPFCPLMRVNFDSLKKPSRDQNPSFDIADIGQSPASQVVAEDPVNSSKKDDTIAAVDGEQAHNGMAIGLSQCLAEAAVPTNDISISALDYCDTCPGGKSKRKAIGLLASLMPTTATPSEVSSTGSNDFARAVSPCPASMGAVNIESERPLTTEVIGVNSVPQPHIECGIGPLSGFSTAGRGVPIAVSEESLANATNAWSGLASTSVLDCNPSSVAYPAAAGWEKAREAFGSDMTKAYVDKKALSTKLDWSGLHCGFTTAGKGVDIAISEESLIKAQKVLHGLAAAMPIHRISSSAPDCDLIDKGFATLAPDSISVSSKKGQDAFTSKTHVEAIHPCLGFGADGKDTPTDASGDSLTRARFSQNGMIPTSMDDDKISPLSCLRAVGRKQVPTAFDALPSESVVHRESSSTSLVDANSAHIDGSTGGKRVSIMTTETGLTPFRNRHSGRFTGSPDNCLPKTDPFSDTIGTLEPDDILTRYGSVRSGLSSTALEDARAGFSTAGKGMAIAISEDSFAKAAKVLNGSARTSSAHSICSPFPSSDAVGTEMASFASTSQWTIETKDLSVSSAFGAAATNTIESGIHVGMDEVRRPPSVFGLDPGVRPLAPFVQVGSSAETALQRKNSEAQKVYRRPESDASIITNEIISTEIESKGWRDDPSARMSRVVESQFDCRDSLLTPSEETIQKLECVANVAEPEYIQRLNTSRSLCHVFGVHCTTIDVNSTNATSLRFDLKTGRPLYYLGDQHSNDGVGGANAMRQALSRCCVDIGILSDRWFLNHSRWIIWKLASIERRFPREAGGRLLTFQRLICELKSRYDKEVRCGMRSSIRKVLNKDVSSTTTMILCVSKIHARGEHSIISSGKPSRSKPLAIELTDGWYGVTAVVDEQLKDKLDKGIMQTGTKISVCNSILIGAGEGIDPLDASYDSLKPDSPVYMVLNANATRLAAWNSRLGFVKPSKRLMENRSVFKCRRLSDIIVGGGIVPCIDLLVCRVYPMLHFQRNGLQRNNDSLSSVLTETEEYARRAAYEQKRTQAMDRAIEMVDMECFKNVEDEGLTLRDTLQRKGRNSEPLAGPSERDRRTSDKWIRQREALIRSRMQSQVDATLDEIVVECGESTPFISLFVKSATEGICDGALLTVWNATESQEAILNEGEVITFRNLVVKSSKRDGLLQLTARESTPMHEAHYDVKTRRSIGYLDRSFAPLFRHHTLSRKLCLGFPLPFQGQHIDIAGSIVRVVQSNAHQYKIYLSDDSGLVSRIDRSCSAEVANAFVSMSVNSRGALKPIAFRDVRVMPYDYVECCAVAAFTHNSTFSTTNRVWTSMALTSNHDDALARRVAVAIEAGTSIHAITRYLIFCPVNVAVGRIVGCEQSARGSTRVFNIKVDCGSTTLHTWELPSFLMDDVLKAIGDRWRPTSLSPRKSKRSGSSRGFQRGLMASGVLLRFVLQAKMTSYEVRQLCIADCHAVSALHLVVQRKRLAQRRQLVRE